MDKSIVSRFLTHGVYDRLLAGCSTYLSWWSLTETCRYRRTSTRPRSIRLLLSIRQLRFLRRSLSFKAAHSLVRALHTRLLQWYSGNVPRSLGIVTFQPFPFIPVLWRFDCLGADGAWSGRGMRDAGGEASLYGKLDGDGAWVVSITWNTRLAVTSLLK